MKRFIKGIFSWRVVKMKQDLYDSGLENETSKLENPSEEEVFLDYNRGIFDLRNEKGRRCLGKVVNYNVLGCSSSVSSEEFILDLSHPYENSDLSGLMTEIRSFAVATNSVFSYDSGKDVVRVTPMRGGNRQ
jgi:hypothetical protein